MQRRIPAVLAILILISLCMVEAQHFVRGEPWPGYTPVVNYVSLFYLSLWIVTASWLVAFPFTRPVLPAVAFATIAMHGLLVGLSLNPAGYLYLGGAVLLFVLMAVARVHAGQLIRPRPHYG